MSEQHADTAQASPPVSLPYYKLGRPTSFRRDLCQHVVDFCSKGFSLTAFAGKIGVCRDTIADWQEHHPEFSEACKRAKSASALAWEERGANAATRGASGGQVAMIIFMLKNHAPDEFRERIEHTGKDGEALSLELLLGKMAEEKPQAIQAPTIEHEAG